MHLDPTAILVALIAFASAALGIVVSRRGQAKSEQLEEKRNEIERQRTDADRMAKTYDAMQGMLEAAIAQREHCEQVREAEAARHERELENRDVHIDQLTSALATLQSIVTDDIADAAVEQYADDDTPEARQAIKDFMRTMRQIGENP